MALSFDHNTNVVTIPKADTTLVSAGPPEIRSYDVFEKLWKEIKAYEDDANGIALSDIQSHNTLVTVGGVTLAHVVRILSPWTLTFEAGTYQVNLTGANHNLLDVANTTTNPALRSANSAGLIQVSSGSGVTEQDKLDIADRVWDEVGAQHVTAGSLGKVVDDVLVDTAAMQPLIDVAVSSRTAPGAAMTLTTAERNAIATALLDLANGVETGITPRQLLRAIGAVLGGDDPSGGGTPAFKAIGDKTIPRVTVNASSTGVRTVTLTL